MKRSSPPEKLRREVNERGLLWLVSPFVLVYRFAQFIQKRIEDSAYSGGSSSSGGVRVLAVCILAPVATYIWMTSGMTALWPETDWISSLAAPLAMLVFFVCLVGALLGVGRR